MSESFLEYDIWDPEHEDYYNRPGRYVTCTLGCCTPRKSFLWRGNQQMMEGRRHSVFGVGRVSCEAGFET